MKRNWDMLNPSINPGQKEVAVHALGSAMPIREKPGVSATVRSNRPIDTIGIVADVRTPVARIIPWLRVAVEVLGAKNVQIVSQRTLQVKTAALGNLQRVRFCGASLRIEPDGFPLEEVSTWGDVTRAFGRGQDNIRIRR
jgi:hypothetical protein